MPNKDHAQLSKNDDKTIFGFWLYIMTDCILFASLFATFIVLRNNATTGQYFDLNLVLVETLILLTSSFTCGLALLSARNKQKNQVLLWISLTFLLGLAFLAIELSEFHKLASEGNSWNSNAFFSGFFTLVGTHGLHITAGLTWLSVLAIRLYKFGFEPFTIKRLTMFSLFWHFLDIVWIFIFSIVYMIGAL